MDDFRLINLDKLNWEQWHPQFEGTYAKTIFIDKKTGANLRQAFLPAGFKLNERKRHHHGETREGVYTLFGNVRYQEFENPGKKNGKENNFKKGFLLDRPPYSIHGPIIENITDLGCLILEWGSGPLHFNYIPFDTNLTEHNEIFNGPKVVDSRNMEWENHPSIKGLKIKVLSNGNGSPMESFHPICKIFIPPGLNLSNQNIIGENYRKWMYVLNGDLPVSIKVKEQYKLVDHRLNENDYLEWFSPANLLLCQNEISTIGCELLCVGHDLSEKKNEINL